MSAFDRNPQLIGESYIYNIYKGTLACDIMPPGHPILVAVLLTDWKYCDKSGIYVLIAKLSVNDEAKYNALLLPSITPSCRTTLNYDPMPHIPRAYIL